MRLKKTQRQKNPFLSSVDESTFYPYTARTRCLHSIIEAFQGPGRVILVIGDFGSGKTLMLQEFLADNPSSWEPCRINPRLMDELAGPRPGKMMREFKAYLHQGDGRTALLLDDAHHLETDEFLSLLRLTGLAGGDRQADKVLLFTEPSLLGSLNELSDMLVDPDPVEQDEDVSEQPAEDNVRQIVIPRLTRMETETYVLKRLNSIQWNEDEPLFSADDLDWVFEESGGYPGGINETAARLFTQRLKDRSRLSMFLKNFF